MQPGSRRRLRVLTIVDSLMTSGAEILATQIAITLDQDRFESTLCSTWPSAPENVGAARRAGVEVLELNRRSRFDLVRWWPLVRRLRAGEFDVVHAHKFGSNTWAALLSHVASIPVLVTHEHTWSFSGKPLRRLVDRILVSRAATACISVSASDREKMIVVEGIDPAKIQVVANGILDRPPGHGERLRAELAIPADAPVVGTVCALRPQKALDVAITGVALARVPHPDLHFVVVGDGPERERLERLAAESLGERAHFIGRRPNEAIPDLLAAMDVVVCSSDFEGSPLSILEWMAAGRAIVATAVGGLPDIIEDGVEGLLVPARDAKALGSAIERLLREPLLRQRLGAAAQQRQGRDFRLESTVAVVERLYETLYWTSPHGVAELAGRRTARSPG